MSLADLGLPTIIIDSHKCDAGYKRFDGGRITSHRFKVVRRFWDERVEDWFYEVIDPNSTMGPER